MAYSSYLAGSPVTTLAPNQNWISDFSGMLDEQLNLMSDYFVITEELTVGSGSFTSVGVRILDGQDENTGVKLGDDWKKLVFYSNHSQVFTGYKFLFDSNYWIVSNANTIKSLLNSAVVRRCNDSLRWTDPDGNYYEETCAIEYVTSRSNNRISRDDPVTGLGNTTAYCQLNSKTNKIKENQRFLIGNSTNWRCFKVLANGIRNYLNNNTNDNNSCTILEITMETNQRNEELDNLTLGIADFYKYSTSGSVSNNIVVTPSNFDIITGGSQIFNVTKTGSFVFTINDALVPSSYYTFSSIDGNNFSVVNNHEYLDNYLNILCTGASGSRIVSVSLMGAW